MAMPPGPLSRARSAHGRGGAKLLRAVEDDDAKPPA